jgi:DNA mismatch endonuclease, patch repair protein
MRSNRVVRFGMQRTVDSAGKANLAFRFSVHLPLCKDWRFHFPYAGAPPCVGELCMVDVFTSAKRSQIMAAIRSSENERTELRLLQLFRRAKIAGWRRRQKVVGMPDFVFRVSKIAVFVDGCFWHGCPSCKRFPKSNQDFWRRKFAKNKRRDRAITQALQKEGWRVVRIWEHTLRDGAACQLAQLKQMLTESARD